MTLILDSFVRFVIIAKTSSSVTILVTKIGFSGKPIPPVAACGLTITNKVKNEVVVKRRNKCKNQFDKDQQTIASSEKIFRKGLQGVLIDKNEYESLFVIFTNYLDVEKNVFMLKCQLRRQFTSRI